MSGEPKGPTDYEVVAAMRRYGGSFARALADAFEHADPLHFQRLRSAFPDLWEEYARMAAYDARDVLDVTQQPGGRHE